MYRRTALSSVLSLHHVYIFIGAGDGNRTHVASLEGWNSTIELHPRMGDDGAVDETRTRDLHLGKVALYQLSYYRMVPWGGVEPPPRRFSVYCSTS